ncbi:MAG: type IV toxin-antitoxin system AbiEi family antitoxin domain-containing protein [Kiritimatiellae bacterium]|nr:type IV toxin-antitoxin system AbiEi family antitoxin domain-containing protein [Kiritimatiellia bacterium]MCO5062613.1 type IV toxin-antitoxin system AbiEi family antitoxin domain-containing protein [Kiritimatiellia bacterium]MCO5068523.1 type IV toxin-antitoxin system AbiEi family antitoxin domain-containing protein [Kiritimatiellia bacterium]
MQPKDKLRAIAAQQAGFFTAAQASEAGYPDSLHIYHTREGHWQKVQRGIYRFTDSPPADWPELVIWSLWSRDRNGNPQIVYSHETAEQIHGLRPRTADKLHVTVPRTFRKNCALPSELIFHKNDLPQDQIEQRPGYRVIALATAHRSAPAADNYDHIIDIGED